MPLLVSPVKSLADNRPAAKELPDIFRCDPDLFCPYIQPWIDLREYLLRASVLGIPRWGIIYICRFRLVTSTTSKSTSNNAQPDLARETAMLIQILPARL